MVSDQLQHLTETVWGSSEMNPFIRALSLELFICMCSNELDFFRCSFSSSSNVHMLRRCIWSTSYMAFRAATVFRPADPGELTSIHGEEQPSEPSSCERKKCQEQMISCSNAICPNSQSHVIAATRWRLMHYIFTKTKYVHTWFMYEMHWGMLSSVQKALITL